MTLTMKSLAISKFCSPMLSELSSTNRMSMGPHLHSAGAGAGAGQLLVYNMLREEGPAPPPTGSLYPKLKPCESESDTHHSKLGKSRKMRLGDTKTPSPV